MTTVIHMHRDNTITARTTPTRILSPALKTHRRLGMTLSARHLTVNRIMRPIKFIHTTYIRVCTSSRP
ncbi:MAG: hypothetical protein E6943_09290 [Actinomyces sp.]|nr:hypothetical protein [Actinomyces sp.]